jgi:hypothetical protein
MRITISVANVSVAVDRITAKAENDPAFWTFAAEEWHRLYEPYVPMDQGVLKDTVTIRPKEIEHTAIYARYQYNGDGFNFRRDKHPKASAHWDQAAAPTQLPKLAQSMQNYIDSGRLNLD